MSKIIPGLGEAALKNDLFINVVEKTSAKGPWEILQGAIDAFVKLAEPGFLALAAVGILAMAMIETLKYFYPWRRSFQRKAFMELIEKRARDQEKAGRSIWSSKKAFYDIVNLATAGNEDALFDLPVKRFAGQVNAAMQIAVAYPDKYPDVIRAMAHAADEEDINLLCGKPPGPDSDPMTLKEFSDARNRAASLAQRSLDAIQIDFGDRWAKDQHRLSVFLSVVIIAGSALWYHYGLGNPVGPRVYVFWAIIAIVGGMIAPVAKNIVTALKKVKDRPR